MSTANIAKRKSRSLRQARRLTAYAFLLPNILGFVTLTLIPIVAAFGLSFLDWDFANPAKFVG